MDTLLQDLHYALRRLFKNPGFTLVAVLTLALGIGANSAIFSVVNGVLLEPLPYANPDQLVGVFQMWEGRNTVMSPPNFLDVQKEIRSLSHMAARDESSLTLTGRGEPVRLEAAEVTPQFFDVLQVDPLIGRTFCADESRPGNHRVAILSYGLWQDRFGGREDVINTTATLSESPYVIVGVMPQGFSFPEERDLWVPIEQDESFTVKNRGAWYLSVIGRLKPGVSIEQANTELRTIARRLEQAYPQANTKVGMAVQSLHEAIVGPKVRTALLVLLGAVGFVLLIACANVANLLLARAATRESEIAVRAALGASRGRIVRQLVTESVLLGVLGGSTGLLFAIWGSDVLIALQPQDLPRLHDIRIDRTVIGFTAACAILTGVLFGIVPAVQLTRGSLVGSLKEGGRGAPSGGSSRLRASLVIAEMALAVTLLVGAGLLIRSFALLQRMDPGFAQDDRLTFRMSLSESKYDSDEKITRFYEDALERLQKLPGVQSVGSVMGLPLKGLSFTLSFNVDGWPERRPGEDQTMEVRVANPSYLETMGIPLIRGRRFDERDRMTSPQVVLLSEAAVKRYFAKENPIGKRIKLGWRRKDKPNVGGEVIGIVGTVKQSDLAGEDQPEIYVPHAQVPVGSMDVVLRTSVPPLSLAPTVRNRINEMDSGLALAQVQTMEQIVARSISQPRFYMVLLGTFAALALLLAAIGIFGVMSYTVAQRTREIGIRIALGADRASVVGMVVRQAMWLATSGVIVGVAAALVVSRTLGTLLYELSPTDPATFATVAGLLLVVGFAASYLPARRATAVDPLIALRSE